MARKPWYERIGGVLTNFAGGAIAGAGVGGIAGLGIGAVPGAMIGGALGLGKGLFEDYDQDQATQKEEAAGSSTSKSEQVRTDLEKQARGDLQAADDELAGLEGRSINRGGMIMSSRPNAAFEAEKESLGKMKAADIDQFKTAFALQRARSQADMTSQYGGANAFAQAGFNADMAAGAATGEGQIGQAYSVRELDAKNRIRQEILQKKAGALTRLQGVGSESYLAETSKLDRERQENQGWGQLAGIGMGLVAPTLLETLGVPGFQSGIKFGGNGTTDAGAAVAAGANKPQIPSTTPPGMREPIPGGVQSQRMRTAEDWNRIQRAGPIDTTKTANKTPLTESLGGSGYDESHSLTTLSALQRGRPGSVGQPSVVAKQAQVAKPAAKPAKPKGAK